MSIKAMEWASNLTLGKASYKSVLVALSWIHHDKNNRCDPSITTLCEFTELNRKTVISALSWLEKAALVSPGKHRGTTTNYILNMHETSPKNGTASRRDTSSNFGTGQDGATSPKNGTGLEETSPKIGTALSADEAQPVPNLDPVTKTHQSQNWDPTSTKFGTGPIPNLEHNRVGSRERDKTSSCERSENEPYLRAAHAMWDHIQPITKQQGEPNFETWARDLRLLVERDGEDTQTVWRVFRWANSDPFWQANILSPAKLRKQFGQLRAKMERPSDTHGPPRGPAGSTRRTTLEDDLNDTSWATGGSG